jgi:hypothetical protein
MGIERCREHQSIDAGEEKELWELSGLRYAVRLNRR